MTRGNVKLNGFGETLLISCYELGHQPMGLALPLAFLERANFRPDILDLSVERLNIDKVKRARFIAISVPMHTALRIGIDAAVRIREINADCHISFFGLYASLNEEILLKDVADSVIGGEYESSLLGLVKALSSEDDSSINGVSVRGDLKNPPMVHLPIPVPNRQSLPALSKYAYLIEGEKERLVGYVEASRGCRYLCRHCPIPPVYNGRFFIFPKEVVIQDIKNLVEMGATHITFGDPDFLNGPVHSLRIVQSLHTIFPHLTFDFTAKVEHLIKYQSHLPELSLLGCIFIISAVESFCDSILSCLDKGHTRADAIQVFHLSKEAGIALRPTFVPFTPWTTRQDLLDLFDTIEKEGMIDYVDPVQYTIRLLIPPGSLLLSDPKMIPYIDSLDENAITYRWAHPDPQLDQLQKRFSHEVERGTDCGRDPSVIFSQLKEYVLATIEEREPLIIQDQPARNHALPPRLSESWFCCSEPTDRQLDCIE